MTSDIVVDSCVIVKWLVKEVDSDFADRLLADIAAAGRRPVVLDIALSEVANALWMYHRRGLLTDAEVAGRLTALWTIPLEIVPAIPLISPAAALAINYGRSVYDSLFVALAAQRGGNGVTADRPLIKAVHGDYPGITSLNQWP